MFAFCASLTFIIISFEPGNPNWVSWLFKVIWGFFLGSIHFIFSPVHAMFFTDSDDIKFDPVWIVFFMLWSIKLVGIVTLNSWSFRVYDLCKQFTELQWLVGDYRLRGPLRFPAACPREFCRRITGDLCWVLSAQFLHAKLCVIAVKCRSLSDGKRHR